MRRFNKFNQCIWKLRPLVLLMTGIAKMLLLIVVVALLVFSIFMMYQIASGKDVIGLAISYFFGSQVEEIPRLPFDPNEPLGDDTISSISQILSQIQVFLTFISVTFGVLLAIGGILTWYLKKRLDKLEQIEKQLETLDRTVLAVMEVAISSLPNPDESQHVPLKTAELAREIVRILADNPELQDTLDRVGNGARLKLTLGLYYFFQGDYRRSIEHFKQITDNSMGDLKLRELVYYRLGIAYRQIKQYYDSVECFRILEDSHANSDLATLGKILTYYKAYKDYKNYKSAPQKFWHFLQVSFPSDDQIIKSRFQHITKNLEQNYLSWLLSELYDLLMTGDNILLKFYSCRVIWELSDSSELVDYDYSYFKKLTADVLKFEPIEKDNAILANYFLGFALENKWYLDVFNDLEGPVTRQTVVREQLDALRKGKEYCTNARRFAEKIEKTERIYSEEQLCEISRDEFKKEVSELENRLKDQEDLIRKNRKKRINELFNKFAKDYEQHEKDTNHIKAQEKVLEEIVDELCKQEDKGLNVLDIATGPGIIPKIVVNLLSDRVKQIVGIDFCEAMIKEGQKNLVDDDRIKLLTYDIEDERTVKKIGEAYGKFDLITVGFGFTWFSDRTVVVNAIKDLIDANGTLIVLEEFYKTLGGESIFSEKAKELPFIEELKELDDRILTFELIDLLRNNGFLYKGSRNFSYEIDSLHAVIGLVFKKAT